MKWFNWKKLFDRKRDKRWLIGMLPLAAVIWSVFAALSGILLRLRPNRTDMVIWLFLAVILSAALCGFGYAGLKLAFGFTALGIVAGIGLMAYVFTRPVAYKGIAGLVSGMELTVFFFLVGINVQMLGHLRKKRFGGKTFQPAGMTGQAGQKGGKYGK